MTTTQDPALQRKLERIQTMNYAQLLGLWRFAPIGSEPNEVWDAGKERMDQLRRESSDPTRMHVSASKAVGWDTPR